MQIQLFSSMGPEQVLHLMRNIAEALRSGVPLVNALELFEHDATRSERRVLSHLRKGVESGHNFSDVLASSPVRFPSIVINLIRTGEKGGTLQESLGEIVKHLRKSRDLKRKIRSAMMYPLFVLIAVLGLTMAIGTLVLPQLIPLFRSLDVTLPLSTEILMSVAEFFDKHGILFSLTIMLLLTGLIALSHVERCKPFFHKIFLWIPYIRAVQKQIAMAQMATTLHTLQKTGIPIDQGIEASALTVSNRIYRKAFAHTASVIRSGKKFSFALQHSSADIPRMFSALIDVGEQTGTLTESLAYLASYYEEEIDYAVKNLTTALEPLLLIFIGSIVGGTVLAIITPIYDVTSSIQ